MIMVFKIGIIIGFFNIKIGMIKGVLGGYDNRFLE